MGRSALAVLVALAALAVSAAAAVAPTAAEPRIAVTPAVVDRGDEVTIAGRGWPVFENCSRQVRLRLESDQNAVPIARLRVSTRGRFTQRFTPRRGEIGPGRWRVVARMRCESGKDGSPFTLRRAAALRIR